MGAAVALLLAGTALSRPVLADGGAGGASGSGPNNPITQYPGGVGGTGIAGAAGSTGQASPVFTNTGGGGGGGGAAGGGIGGNGASTVAFVGGAGGAAGAAGIDGESATIAVRGGAGGGGGGGGFNGFFGATLSGAASGGDGGDGGKGGDASNSISGALGGGGGGGGGAGGYGAIVTGATVNANTLLVAGGNGGTGGVGGASFNAASGPGVQGAGGDGGVGILFTASGASLTNSGTVRGGDGGSGSVNGLGGVGISGAGLTIINSGTITGGMGGDGITQANAITFTGGANTLTLQNGYTINGNVVGTGGDTLALGGATSSSFDISKVDAAQQYRGFSALVKSGTSTWTVTGAQTATAAWSVNAGMLSVNGDISSASSVTVNTGGMLGGTGTVAATTINAGGTFAPGSGVAGTSMAVNGALALQSEAIYLVQVDPATASFANITGTATLGGATVSANFANGSYIAKKYTILTAGAVQGTFGSLANTNLPTNFSNTLSYDATHAYLNLALSFVPPTAPGYGNGLNMNQQNVANTLVNYFNTTGGIPTVFGALNANGLTQVSGETATRSQQVTFDAMAQFMGIMTDPFTAGRGTPTPGALGYADDGRQYSRPEREAFAMFTKAPPKAYEARWNVWAAGFGGSRSTDGNAALGSNSATSSIYGAAVGADYWFSPATVAGFSMAGGGTNFSVANGGSGRSDLVQAGAFLRHSEGSAYVAAAVAYGWQSITTDRLVSAGVTDRLQAAFNANAYSGRIEVGNRWLMPTAGGIGVTPYAAVQVTAFDLPAYAETSANGATTFGLNYAGKTVTDTRTELGLRTDKSFALNDALLTLRGRAAWAHDFNSDRSIAATFQSLPGASFTVNGAVASRNAALTSASAEMKWSNGWAVAATFDGEFSGTTRSYAGKGVVRYAW